MGIEKLQLFYVYFISTSFLVTLPEGAESLQKYIPFAQAVPVSVLPFQTIVFIPPLTSNLRTT